MVATVFIDGEAGTTGLGIRERLDALPNFSVRSIDPGKRKDPQARKEMMASVDAVVLCLPDDAAKESAALAASLGDRAPRVLAVMHEGAERIRTVFAALVAEPARLMPSAQARIERDGLHRATCDYVAGMTDRYLGRIAAAL